VTATQTRDAIVEHLIGDGWVPIAELAEWMRYELNLSRGQGAGDLRALVRDGRLERRRDPTKARGFYRAYEYRVPA